MASGSRQPGPDGTGGRAAGRSRPSRSCRQNSLASTSRMARLGRWSNRMRSLAVVIGCHRAWVMPFATGASARAGDVAPARAVPACTRYATGAAKRPPSAKKASSARDAARLAEDRSHTIAAPARARRTSRCRVRGRTRRVRRSHRGQRLGIGRRSTRSPFGKLARAPAAPPRSIGRAIGARRRARDRAREPSERRAAGDLAAVDLDRQPRAAPIVPAVGVPGHRDAVAVIGHVLHPEPARAPADRPRGEQRIDLQHVVGARADADQAASGSGRCSRNGNNGGCAPARRSACPVSGS